MKQQCLTSFFLVNKILNISLALKNIIRPLWIFLPDMIIYKIYSDKTKCIYFIIKDEKILINIWQFQKKLAIS